MNLGNEKDLRDQFNTWHKYLSNPLSSKEINILSKSNAEKAASRWGFATSLKFHPAYNHLKARAEKADSFLNNLTQLYDDFEDMDVSLKQSKSFTFYPLV